MIYIKVLYVTEAKHISVSTYDIKFSVYKLFKYTFNICEYILKFSNHRELCYKNKFTWLDGWLSTLSVVDIILTHNPM